VIIEREKERASGSVRHEKIVTKPGEIERWCREKKQSAAWTLAPQEGGGSQTCKQKVIQAVLRKIDLQTALSMPLNLIK
jgi:hypothetical protein